MERGGGQGKGEGGRAGEGCGREEAEQRTGWAGGEGRVTGVERAKGGGGNRTRAPRHRTQQVTNSPNRDFGVWKLVEMGKKGGETGKERA